MKRTETASVLEINIGELKDFLAVSENHWRVGDLTRAFSTEWVSDEYTIPAADTGRNLTFNSLEILRRFSLLSCNHQRTFLIALRRAMEENSVKEARVEVGWSPNRTRVLTVKSFGDGAHHLLISI